MKNLLVPGLFFCLIMLLGSCTRTDLGQLKMANYNAAGTYCIYTISKQVSSDDNFFAYNVGDTICIECCTTRNPDPWPAANANNNPCPANIKFKTSDGKAVYEAGAINPAICSTCPGSQGYYACP